MTLHETAINGSVPDTTIADTAITDTAITGSRVIGADGGSVRRVRTRVARHLVGRERELDLLLAAVAAGRDVLLEGPPGTSKSTLLRAITTEWGIPLLFVEGNADLTPTRLVGHHNPARVLREDYTADNFVPGPLVEAMRSGGFLYVEEFNRAPKGLANLAAYTTTKHGIVGLMKVLANELGPRQIRVNTIHPNSVDTPMIQNKAAYRLFRPDLDEPTMEDAQPAFESLNPMKKAYIEPVHVSNLVLFLASDESAYISGGEIPVDAGAAIV